MRFVIGLLRQTWAGLLVMLALTLVLGIGYPAAVWTVSRIDASAAEGSALADANGCVVGSRLIGIDPQVPAGEPDPFFHARVLGSVADQDPFATGDPAASAASNLGPSSETLADFVAQRRMAIAERDGVDPSAVPADAVTGSGSGLDPQISPAYAAIQVPRVARVNGMAEDRVRQLVEEHTSTRTLGFLGAERVDVPELNLALGHAAPECGHNVAPHAPLGG
ncbi:potassium-transporting ATPase subunit C [Aldersonia sp. NBC_00410]|uniref:potassium-transporting ATPase subunit C n=1 Tax=Aldersonia sp. NBC_00410 TaxID=2975954 RepID=UPI002257B50D|nr:potassium-transporting ATPase subunit C [Aldersonia sp. NBC_00410]MCX5046002.1 potassium-transporting ATPase subunit C [Aldersonia sp. NBC_00410]